MKAKDFMRWIKAKLNARDYTSGSVKGLRTDCAFIHRICSDVLVFQMDDKDVSDVLLLAKSQGASVEKVGDTCYFLSFRK